MRDTSYIPIKLPDGSILSEEVFMKSLEMIRPYITEELDEELINRLRGKSKQRRKQWKD